jgi:hypothetical protein
VLLVVLQGLGDRNVGVAVPLGGAFPLLAQQTVLGWQGGLFITLLVWLCSVNAGVDAFVRLRHASFGIVQDRTRPGCCLMVLLQGVVLPIPLVHQL